ncbi:pseudouridine synthase [Verminephrobacter aporrectodeae subsp. tuberculatae]|uniref:Pseudouridine synthase n=1 Tax=Verminephrobacter aporrectodeae subsp. tuberculatae TaxID=1110392 RepID=A0ABT3KRK0_9BURK|nr:hypothetical protein [Verminephrobacter aporrectodeae]MCW5320554.1 pseudouridine synthase [Verminephrobacter aporrectodeae subsp. tuberculatae]
MTVHATLQALGAWLHNLLIAIDQLGNTLLDGAPDETLSSRAHRMRIKGQPCWGWTARAINCLFFWQANHCKDAYESEQRRLQRPPALRD